MSKEKSTNFDMKLADEGNNAREVFFEDYSNKKLIARSAIKRITHKELFSEKDVKKYAGGIKHMSLYDTIMSFEQFQRQDKETKLKYIEGWESNGFSRQEIADKWGKKLQAVHDMVYRLRKDLDKVSGGATTNKPSIKSVANTETDTNQLIKPVDTIYPFSIQKISEYSGDQIEKFINKALELVDDPSNMLKVYIGIKKVSQRTTRLNLTLELDAELSINELKEELKNMYNNMLNSADRYTITFDLKELNKKVE